MLRMKLFVTFVQFLCCCSQTYSSQNYSRFFFPVLGPNLVTLLVAQNRVRNLTCGGFSGEAIRYTNDGWIWQAFQGDAHSSIVIHISFRKTTTSTTTDTTFKANKRQEKNGSHSRLAWKKSKWTSTSFWQKELQTISRVSRFSLQEMRKLKIINALINALVMTKLHKVQKDAFSFDA